MALEIRQQLKMVQRQVMTPQLQQAIRLLQLNHQDLVAAVEEELLENPTLEVTEVEEDGDPAREALEERARTEQEDELERKNGAETNETDWQKVLEGLSESAFKTGTGRGTRYDDLPPIESTLAASETLVQHLLGQLGLTRCTDEERRAATVIILSLDERGFLPLEVEQVAEMADVHPDDVEGAIEIVQGLDPVGCGSRSLEECLAYQAHQRWPEDPYIVDLIEHHLHDFERRNYAEIAALVDMEEEDAVEYHKMIQSLEPRPARGFSDAEPRFVTPDVYVFKVGDEWHIRLNEDGLPKLRVSPYYRRVIQDKEAREAGEFIRKKLESADFLIKSIYRRQATILKVVRCILERQIGFFEHGVSHLRPMVLRDVADEIGVHESTVSRVTSNKYMQCPHGLLELKFFFTSGLRQTRGGADVSAEAVRHRIKQLVAEEDPKRPLSDSAIQKQLAAEGVRVARRTVAKYREQLGILSSSKRRRLF